MTDKLIISVGRQLGSGGCEIARALADSLGCRFFDKELLNLAAEQSGFRSELFERQDENHGILKSAFDSFTGRISRSFDFYKSSISQESLFLVQSEAIQKAAEDESCVFVGRCADYILRDHPGLFSVFITADEEQRISTVAERRQCSLDDARKYIQQKEKERADYYNYYTSKKWGAAQSYDMCINSSIMGIQGTAEYIAMVIRNKTNKQLTK